ncbi:MAG: hypothetical protein HQ518_24400, partial [Rhodopirellula sp.]|nr:hypothetical protein [Rhodopirellula sp.]
TSLVRSAERFEAKTLLSAFVVDSLVDQPDANPGDGIAATTSGETTLRAAVQEANAAPGPDTIILPPGLFDLSLSGPSDHSAASGDLEITDDLTIVGAGSDQTFIDATQIDSAFHIHDGVSLTFDELTLQISAGSQAAIVNNGGTLTIDGASVDEIPPLSIPAINHADITTNARHADLLIGLYQPVVNRNEPLDAIFAPPPIFVSIVNPTKTDATIAIGTERSRSQLKAEDSPELNPTPRELPTEQLNTPVRVAEQSPEVPGETTQQRRRAVVNSLFEDQTGTKPQTVKPVAGEQSENAAAENRRLHEKFPMLLPMNDNGTLQVVPEKSAIDRPAPPPLPEPVLLKEAAAHTRRTVGQPATGQALMAGMLLTMVRPGVIRRAVRRLTGRKNHVV